MLVLGVLLLVASLFAIEALRRTYGAPAPARWTKSDTLGNLIAVGITAAVGVGGTATIFGAIEVVTAEASWVQAIIAIAIVAASVGLLVAWRRVRSSRPPVPMAHA